MIRSAPDHTKVTEALSPDKAGVFTEHCVVLFEYNSFVNASSHPCKFVYEYANGDFEALHDALSAINLSSIVGHKNIDDDGRCRKDLLLAAVKDFRSIEETERPLPGSLYR